MSALSTLFYVPAICLATVASLLASASQAEPERPNVVMIIVDDLGWRDLGCYGSELYQTPAVDALAAEGLSFSNAYASSPLCTPTRASILTGQTVGRLRLTTPVGHVPEVKLDAAERASAAAGLPMTEPETNNRIPLDSITISKLLEDAGYATAFMGKWHLGYDPYIPENFGFDHVVGGRGFPGPPPPGFFGPWDTVETNMPAVEGHPNADDVIGDAAVDFIESKQDEPFFLALWFFNVHAPFQGKPELIEKYRPLAAQTQYQKSAIMGAMVETMDQNVGKVTEALKRLGLDENTIVIFSSDNGGNMYDRPEGENPTNNYPLKAGKGNNYEGGSRVPLIVKWPGQVAAGGWTDTIAISYDFFPTLLDVAQLETPEAAVLDGVSLRPAFSGELMQRPPVTSMFGHTVLATGNLANAWVRDGKWKLLRFFNLGADQEDLLELYDLSIDSGETQNLALEHAEVAERLNDWLEAHLVETETLLPRKNPNCDPEMKQAGFVMQSGGYFIGGPDASKATITSNADRVVLRYYPEVGATGDQLEFQLMSNCVISAAVGLGDGPLYGAPVTVNSDLTQGRVIVPLGRAYERGPITLLFDMEQPGRSHISAVQLSDSHR
ncbi:sulfatase [Coraliomargarita sp. SDUM461004]|uniref:Sulfatase n=1 Tax=Thalassobacterium sedimentorum TaxID=3041258 RepID=A0ABU1APU3_9BACT|nr:sulfatase [Coraliomargarita sp. SDUM461004]MDQ8195880.1 sulfatase [Coraliomargarita sp. SDUM461004]